MHGWAEVARFYGWTFAYIRTLTFAEYEAARQYLAEYSRSQER